MNNNRSIKRIKLINIVPKKRFWTQNLFLDVKKAKSYFPVEKQLNTVMIAKKNATKPNSGAVNILVRIGTLNNNIIWEMKVPPDNVKIFFK